MRYEVQNDKERAGHGTKCQEALGEIRDSLFHYMSCFEIVSAFVFAFLVNLPDRLGDAQRLSVEGGLGNEAIWKRQSKNTGYTGSQSEEK